MKENKQELAGLVNSIKATVKDTLREEVGSMTKKTVNTIEHEMQQLREKDALHNQQIQKQAVKSGSKPKKEEVSPLMDYKREFNRSDNADDLRDMAIVLDHSRQTVSSGKKERPHSLYSNNKAIIKKKEGSNVMSPKSSLINDLRSPKIEEKALVRTIPQNSDKKSKFKTVTNKLISVFEKDVHANEPLDSPRNRLTNYKSKNNGNVISDALLRNLQED